MSKEPFNPYVGLRPYQTDESLLFFGRDEQTLELLQRLHLHKFVAVVGSSGCGKSSLIRAGLIPALKGGFLIEDSNKWLIGILKPGKQPLYNLAQSIMSKIDPMADGESISSFVSEIQEGGSAVILDRIRPVLKEKKANFFLLVDQFEELFRFSMHQKKLSKIDDAIDFVNLILELSEQKELRFYVVLTMRSDFIGECTLFTGLPEAMNKSQYLVPRLSRRQLKKVIENPATLYGGKLNSALTSKLLNKLGHSQDQLPILQHALMRMWEFEVKTNKSGEIDQVDYENIGGLEKALSRHADEAMADMTARQKELTEILFKALTDVDDSGRKIRRPVEMSDLKKLTGASETELQQVIERFIEDKRSFLIVDEVGDSEDKNIDISHESLIRQWTTLSEWVMDEAETASTYKDLVDNFEKKMLRKKDLLTGSELQLALDWKKKHNPTAVWANRYREGFKESMEYLDESEAERSNQQRKDKTRRKRFNILAVSTIALLLVVIGYGIIDNFKNNARLLHLEAQGVLPSDPTKALLLENRAYKKSSQQEYIDASNSIYQNNSFYKLVAKNAQDPIFTRANLPKNSLSINYLKDDLYLLTNEDSTFRKEIEIKNYQHKTFSRDASQLFLCCDENMQSFSYDFATDSIVKFIRLGLRGGEDLIFAPELDRVIVNGGPKGPVRIYNKKGVLLSTILPDLRDNLSILAIEPTERKLFLSGGTKHELYDSIGNPIVNWQYDFDRFKEMGRLLTAKISRGGARILTGSEKRATLWNLADGTKISEFHGHTDLVEKVKFSPNNGSVFTASKDNTVIHWSLDGKVIEKFIGHTTPVTEIDFSEDGESIRTRTEDDWRVWKLKNSVSDKIFKFDDWIDDISISADGDMDLILISLHNGDAILQNEEGKFIKYFDGHAADEARSDAKFSPDGSRILTGTDAYGTRVWEIEGATIKDSLDFQNTDGINFVAFSQNNDYIVSASIKRSILLKDMTGVVKSSYQGDKTIYAICFAPGTTEHIVAFAAGQKVYFLDMTNPTAKVIEEFHDHEEEISDIAFTEDGSLWASSSMDDSVVLHTKKGKKIFEGHRDGVTSLAFSPNGQFLISGSVDNTAILWDLEGNILRRYVGHADEIFSVGFSSDGTKIITGSKDKTIRYWNATPSPSLDEFMNSGFIESSLPNEDQ